MEKEQKLKNAPSKKFKKKSGGKRDNNEPVQPVKVTKKKK